MFFVSGNGGLTVDKLKGERVNMNIESKDIIKAIKDSNGSLSMVTKILGYRGRRYIIT
jgi:hypothetical protein